MSADLVSAVLRAYADLCPSPQERTMAMTGPDLVSLGTFVEVDATSSHTRLPAEGALRGSWSALERLAKLDALHSDEQLLRQGWVTLVGNLIIDGDLVPVRQPIVSRPVRLSHRSAVGRVTASLSDLVGADDLLLDTLGEFELTPLVIDPGRRSLLLAGMEFGRGGLTGAGASEKYLRRFPALTSWVRSVTDEIGAAHAKILPYSARPADWADRPGLVAIVEHTLYLSREVDTVTQRNSLLGWISRPNLDRSALYAVLSTASGQNGPPSDPTPRDLTRGTPTAAVEIESPLLLSPSQESVVIRSRTERVTVLSGPPGSGKTHTVCAVALDAVAQGRSVLIATQSRYAAEVVAELLHRTPGPEPVRFGNGAGMAELIDELSDRQTHPLASEDVQRLDSELEMARVQVAGLRSSIGEDLQLESDAARSILWRDALPALISAAPRFFDVESDLDHATTVCREARAATDRVEAGGGPFARWGARRARGRLDRAAGSTRGTDLARLQLALDAASSGRAAATLAARGGVRIGDRWDRLWSAEARRRDAVGRRVQARPFEANVLDRAARVSLGQLITALRAGRGRRRELLAEMDASQLTAAAPLWIGTLSEIEDVLPATAGLFDLVVLDEASQIEQSKAAPALLRGRRAVVVGDPHQLRHVSFRSDDDVDAALERNGLGAWRGLLDVRRVSAFDLAAATTPVDQLRDHFRSVPHLIEFSVRHFYRDRVDVMTRHPRNEAVDAIDVVPPPTPDRVPTSSRRSVHTDEVDAVISLVRALHAEGADSIGVVSPFRDQADALEAALVASFTTADITAMSLRVGTVHAFQGGERDIVIASLAMATDDSPGRRRFLEDPNLFNVMITRARTRMIVVTSLPLTDPGLIGEYLRYGEQALSPVVGGVEPAGWTSELATELRRNGVTVRSGYPVGPWHLDLCAGDGEACHDIESQVHPDGPESHIDRHLTLMGLGWSIIDAYPSAWDGDPVRAALELRDRT